jgi:hypothetical protein
MTASSRASVFTQAHHSRRCWFPHMRCLLRSARLVTRRPSHIARRRGEGPLICRHQGTMSDDPAHFTLSIL